MGVPEGKEKKNWAENYIWRNKDKKISKFDLNQQPTDPGYSVKAKQDKNKVTPGNIKRKLKNKRRKENFKSNHSLKRFVP